MDILGKIKNLFASKNVMSHLIEKGRINLRSFAPVYGYSGNHMATVGYLTNACDVVAKNGKVIGQAEKVYRMYKPARKSILGKMNVYEITTSKTPYGKEFVSAAVGKPNGGFTTITNAQEFKGYIKAMKTNSGLMKV